MQDVALNFRLSASADIHEEEKVVKFRYSHFWFWAFGVLYLMKMLLNLIFLTSIYRNRPEECDDKHPHDRGMKSFTVDIKWRYWMNLPGSLLLRCVQPLATLIFKRLEVNSSISCDRTLLIDYDNVLSSFKGVITPSFSCHRGCLRSVFR